MGELLVLGWQSKPLAVTHGDGATGLGVTFQPVENQRLQHQLGIGQVPGTIFLKGFKEFSIEPIGSLAGQRFADTLGGLPWCSSFGHKRPSIDDHRAAGKRYKSGTKDVSL